MLLCAVPALAQSPTLKLGVFDSSVVFDRSQQGRALKAEIERLRDQRLKAMTDRQEELNALQQEMRTKELSFNDEKSAEMKQRINQKQIELQRLNDDAQREVQAEFNKAQQRLQKELIQVVEAVGKAGAFTLVLERGLTLYASAEVDITPAVLDKFDQMFPQTAPAAAAPGGN